jgi:hypothetical protein
MDVVGGLQGAPPGVFFECTNLQPSGGVFVRRCAGEAPSEGRDDRRARYAVEVVAEDPRTVLSVTAPAYGATDREAADFLSYLGGLAVPDESALDTGVWVGANLASWGTTFVGDADVSLYGYEGARALEVTGTGC